MEFSKALSFCRHGKYLIRRTSWNKEEFVMYQEGYPNGIPINKNTASASGLEEGTICYFQPYLQHHKEGNRFVHYIPSMDDLLMEDWEIF